MSIYFNYGKPLGERERLTALFHDALLLAVPVALFDILALVALLLPFGKGDAKFGQTAPVKE